METWFLFALLGAFFAGLHVFTAKISAHRGYNSNLLNSYSSGISAVLLFSAAAFLEDLSDLSPKMLLLGAASGLFFIIATNLRTDGLKNIDATVFLPLHKFIGPLFALVLGVSLFSERLDQSEWIGVILGLLVPLLLLSKSENSRQNNLRKGLVLMILSAAVGVLSQVVNKHGASVFVSALLFAAAVNMSGAIIGGLSYTLRAKINANSKKQPEHKNQSLIKLAIVTAIIQTISFGSLILAFANQGPLAIVYTIHSFYILIPIVLAIIFFNEHWNARKAFAIATSIAAIILLR